MSESAKVLQHPSAMVREAREDGWANPQSGMGMPGVDARVSWVAYPHTRNQRAMRDLWLGDGLAGRIVELPAEDMTRERGRLLLGTGFEDAQTRLEADVDELDVWAKYAQGLKYEAAYGGGALIMAVDDGMAWSQPVDLQRLRKVTALHEATPDELRAVTYFNDRTSPLHGRPATYRWQPSIISGMAGGWVGASGQLVHASRVITFPGLRVDAARLDENQGWGDSVLARCEERIRDMNSALAGVGIALNRFSQDVVTSEGLGDNLADKKGKAALEQRAASMRMTQSLLGLLLLGKGETYERKGISFGGVADTLHEVAASLCATTGIPMAVLMGFAEAGLGDVAASQRHIWHDRVRSLQGTRLRPALNQLLRLMLLAKEGPTGGKEPRNWQVEFNPLEKPTDVETAGLRKTYMEIDTGYAEAQMVRPEHVARNRFNGPDGFNTNLPPDPYMAEVVPYQEPGGEPGPDEGQPAEPAPAAVPPPAEPGTEPGAADEGGAANVQKLSLNGAQVQAAQSVVTQVAERKLPRASGVAMLQSFFFLEPAEAERIMGEVGRSFFITPEGTAPSAPPATPAAPAAPPPPAPRGDGAETYALLWLKEMELGELPREEVEERVGKLYGVRPREARALLKKLGARRQDAAGGPTHFPRHGENRRVSLKSSRFQVFDPAYALDLKENWPEVWALSKKALGAHQFERLLPVARSGGKADTDTEVHAVRLREEWARRNARKDRAAGVVAQVKQLVVGRLGEAGMKRVLEAAKEKARRAREKAKQPTS